MTDSLDFLNTLLYSVMYCAHSWLRVAENSSKYFAVKQNHHELTDLSNDTFFMNTLNEFLFVNGTVLTNPILIITYLRYFVWTEVCHSEGICFKWHFSGCSWLQIMSIPVYETVILPTVLCGFSMWFLKEEYGGCSKSIGPLVGKNTIIYLDVWNPNPLQSSLLGDAHTSSSVQYFGMFAVNTEIEAKLR